ncbi:glycosyltransferase family 39 protein [Thalassoroseus pseudoceratinae]|uniref:glycosyltransferase family 39 protein n=1 Tax=Thalassoroseus pseudoceratinae TaxID=2713176 RepID=UPI0014210ADB|nr:glycosyltransferase family 39 protein [Thalassoroseus pseudoceratinae]
MRFEFDQTCGSSQPFLGPPGQDGQDRAWTWNVSVAKVLIVLLIVAAIPRLVMMLKLTSYCNDAYLYFFLADHLEQGNPAPMLSAIDWNIYPAILACGHHLGFEWGFVGKAWGVLTGTLTVLPLFGWNRRLFGDTVATIACFLYAIHPGMIETGAEPIRDSSFWLFLATYAYLLTCLLHRFQWRTVLGIVPVFLLAVFTRSEAWLLLIPPVMYGVVTLLRDNPLRHISSRWRLRIGMFAGAAIASGVALLGLHAMGVVQLSLGRVSHFAEGWTWLRTTLTGQVDTSSQIMARGFQERFLTYWDNVFDCFTPQNLFMLGVGLYFFHRELRRREMAVSLAFCGCLMAAVWILFARHGVTNGRYFYPVVLTMLPFQAMGLLKCFELYWQTDWTRRISLLSERGAWIFTLATLLGVGYIDAISSRHNSRNAEVEVAEWIRERGIADSVILCDHGSKRIGYHAQEKVPAVIGVCEELPGHLEADAPEWVVMSKRFFGGPGFADLLRETRLRGFELVPMLGHPRADERYLIFHRTSRPNPLPPIRTVESNDSDRRTL